MGVEKRERHSKEEERGNSSSSRMDTGRAEAPVWLMKCPVVVSKSWSSHNPPPIAKVVLSFDPLRADDPSAMEFKMEMPGYVAANLPQSYSLNMFKDFVPMCVFSETNQEVLKRKPQVVAAVGEGTGSPADPSNLSSLQ